MIIQHPHERIARALRVGVAALSACALATPQAAAPGPSGAASHPVAVVTDLGGRSQLQRPGAQRALAILDTLNANDPLELAAGAFVELAFTAGTGTVLRLTGPGRFRVRAADVHARDPGARVERRDLAAAWRSLHIRPGMVGRASIALRGLAATQVTLRSPLGGEDAAGLHRLEWDQPYGHPAAPWDYTVRLIDDQGMLLFVTQSQERSIPVPADLDFERGRDYLWTVQARAGDERHADGAAEFHRIPADVEDRVNEMMRVVLDLRHDPQQPESNAEEVLFALALEQAGMRAAARRQWRALRPLRPALADVVLPAP